MLGWSAFETKFYRSAIPAEVELTFGFATTGSDMTFTDALLPIRHKACGGAIFGLGGATLAAIRDRGLDAVKNGRQGRGYADSRDRFFSYYSYKPWQSTPLPPEWTSQGVWLGLSCMGLGRSALGGILEAAQAPGSFYTTGRGRMLLVIPSLELVVYTYRD